MEKNEGHEMLPVKSMQDLATVGTMLETSGMFGLTRPGSGLVVAMTCFQQRITPLEFVRTYHIIDNKPAMRADAMAAEFRKRGGKYKILQRDSEAAKAEFTFEKQTQVFECTKEQVKLQGFCFCKDGKTVKDNWQKFPENMLWARMMSNAIRVLCPEIVAGVYTPEEIQDFDSPSPREAKPVTTQVADEALKKTAPAAKKAMKDAEVTVDVKAEEIEPETRVDYSICPLEPAVGTPFVDLKDEDLEIISGLKDNPKMKEGHFKEVNEILRLRKEAKTESGGPYE